MPDLNHWAAALGGFTLFALLLFNRQAALSLLGAVQKLVVKVGNIGGTT